MNYREACAYVEEYFVEYNRKSYWDVEKQVEIGEWKNTVFTCRPKDGWKYKVVIEVYEKAPVGGELYQLTTKVAMLNDNPTITARLEEPMWYNVSSLSTNDFKELQTVMKASIM